MAGRRIRLGRSEVSEGDDFGGGASSGDGDSEGSPWTSVKSRPEKLKVVADSPKGLFRRFNKEIGKVGGNSSPAHRINGQCHVAMWVLNLTRHPAPAAPGPPVARGPAMAPGPPLVPGPPAAPPMNAARAAPLGNTTMRPPPPPRDPPSEPHAQPAVNNGLHAATQGARRRGLNLGARVQRVFAVGDIVTISGLENRPDLNGRVGEIVAIDTETGRHYVRSRELGETAFGIRSCKLQLIA